MVGVLRVSGQQTGERLSRAVKQAWAAYSRARKVEDCAWSTEAEARYWPLAEEEFWRRLHERRTDGAARSFRQIAERVYDQITERAASTLRGAKACENARFELYGGRPGKPGRAAPTRTPAAPSSNETETP